MFECVCVCVCVRCSIGGWCTTASVSKYFTPSHHSYAWERFTSFPRFTCRWMCFVLFNIMQSWFRCEQVSKELFCFTNNTVNNQHNLSYMHLEVNVPSNFISCWAKLLYWADILATWAKAFLMPDLYSTHKKLWTFNYNVLFIFDLTLD